MIGRVFLESLAGGWLPQDPLVLSQGVKDSIGTESPSPVGRGIRFGGISGFAWSTLSLLVAAGAVYVVGRTSVWYDAIDVSLMLTACLFFATWIPAFGPANRLHVRVAVAFGMAGALTRFSMYLSTRSSGPLGFGDAVLGLSRMGVFSAIALGGLALVGLAIITGSRLLPSRLLRDSSFGAGVSVLAASVLGFGIGLSGSGWPSANLASISLTSGATIVAVLWSTLVSVGFLRPRTSMGLAVLLCAFLVQIVAAVLIFARLLWLPGGLPA
jgi:hypothetical protein